MPGPAPVTTAVAWAVELETAVQNALCAWLRSAPAGLGANVTTGQPAVSVFPDWPEPDVKLTMPEITVLRAGEPEIEDLDPVVVGAPVSVGGNVYTYNWLVGYATLPLQLDVWTDSRPQRGDVLARLRAALTASPDVTLAAYIATQAGLSPPNVVPLHDPVATEILLQLAPPWANVIAVYYFEKARLSESENVALKDTSSAAGERSWRATLAGSASYEITQTASSPALTSVALQLSTGTTIIKPPVAPGGTVAYDIAFADSPWTVPPGNVDVSVDTTGGDVVLNLTNGASRDTKTIRIRAGTHEALVTSTSANILVVGNANPIQVWHVPGIPGDAVEVTWLSVVAQWQTG